MLDVAFMRRWVIIVGQLLLSYEILYLYKYFIRTRSDFIVDAYICITLSDSVKMVLYACELAYLDASV